MINNLLIWPRGSIGEVARKADCILIFFVTLKRGLLNNAVYCNFIFSVMQQSLTLFYCNILSYIKEQ